MTRTVVVSGYIEKDCSYGFVSDEICNNRIQIARN